MSLFWNKVNDILKSQKVISAPFDIKDIFFRTVHAINYIIFEGKYFIYRSKLNKSHLSISFLKKNVRERIK